MQRISRVPSLVLVAALFASGCIWTEVDDDDDASDTDDGDDGWDPTATSGELVTCDPEFTVARRISGVDAEMPVSVYDTTFFNRSLEEVVFEDVDFELMAAMGLEPEDPEDRERFAYFSKGFELRNLYTEYTDEWYVEDFLPKIGRDVSIAFFDLAAHDVQPGTPVAIFDVSSIEAARDSGDLDALADEIRALVDEMRSNGRPDVVVTFAPDRSDELFTESIVIAMLSPNATFATSGLAGFHSPIDASGRFIEDVAYPNEEIDAVAILVQAEFADGEEFTVDASCMPVMISG